MWQSFVNFILRNRVSIYGIITILSVYICYFSFKALNLEKKNINTLSKDSPKTESYKRFIENIGKDRGTLVIILKADSLYTERNFLLWKQLGDSILQFYGVESILSEATLFTIKKNCAENKEEMHRVFSDITFKEKSIDSIQKEIKNNPIYKRLHYSEKGNFSLMIIGIDEKFLNDKVKIKVVLDIEKLVASYEKKLGKIYYLGLPHLLAVNAKWRINIIR